MTTQAEHSGNPPARSVASPSLLFISLPGPFLALGALLVCALLAGTAYVGATSYPDYTPPTGASAEARITGAFGLPKMADDKLVGDIAIERFYAYEPSTGKRYVADMVKGRVADLIVTQRDDGTLRYSVLLDRNGLKLENVSKLVAEVAPPESGVTYLGVKMQGGAGDVFPVNYSGMLASRRVGFKGPRNLDIYRFLATFQSDNIGPIVRIYTNNDNNYLLNSTRLFSYFTTLFGLKEAVFVARLEFLDATSRPAPTTQAQ